MTRSGLIAAFVWFCGLVAVGIQALSLASRYFQPWLNSDYIYPQQFAEDVLAGHYPLSGWTLSSAPYFFPDMFVTVAMRFVGGGGTVLPAYVIFSYLSLAVLGGWSLQGATNAGWAAWLAAALMVNVLLSGQLIADHAQYIWLLGTVGFHGGVILLGLAHFALWTGGGEAVLPRKRWAVAVAVLFLGALSDTLFLVQVVLPVGVMLCLQAGKNWRSARLRSYAWTVLGALGLMAIVRVALFLGGWFKFSKVVRYAPTPDAIGQAITGFVADLLGPISNNAWGFMGLAVVSLIVALGFSWWNKRQRQTYAGGLKAVLIFVPVSLLVTTLMPLLAAYWRDATHVRYLLPWLVWPSWLITACLLPRFVRWGSDLRCLVALGMVWLSVIAVTLPTIRLPALGWPYTEQQAQMDEFLIKHDLRRGLGDYWHAHMINTLSHAPVRLFALRPDAQASFWNNNAFWYFEAGTDSQRLSVPEYTFIISDGLDPEALLRRFGEPAGKERVGALTIWLYPPKTANGIARILETEVRDFLRGRPGEDRIVGLPAN